MTYDELATAKADRTARGLPLIVRNKKSGKMFRVAVVVESGHRLGRRTESGLVFVEGPAFIHYFAQRDGRDFGPTRTSTNLPAFEVVAND